jgi:hypothetical protein
MQLLVPVPNVYIECLFIAYLLAEMGEKGQALAGAIQCSFSSRLFQQREAFTRLIQDLRSWELGLDAKLNEHVKRNQDSINSVWK